MDSLQETITRRRREISTDAYSMSIGELTSLYRDNELDVHPEFQRVYRWRDEQKSKLIESILLGIPLPSIFVAQTEDGTWDVVDGVQRISTILELQGLLRDERGELLPKLRLTATDFLPQLEGLLWEDSDPARSLTQAQRLDIRRSKVDLKIIKRDSSPTAKYDLFQRLNSYGSQLTPQEVRSCLIISADKTFYSWLNELRNDPNFTEAVAINDRLKHEQYDLELVLRFIALRRLDESQIGTMGNIGKFLDSEAIRFANGDLDRDNEAWCFKQTFQLAMQYGGEDAFRRYNPDKKRFEGAFLNTAFEMLGLGLGYHIEYYATHPSEVRALERAIEVWSDPSLSAGFATGLRADTRMARTIPRGRRLFDPIR